MSAVLCWDSGVVGAEGIEPSLVLQGARPCAGRSRGSGEDDAVAAWVFHLGVPEWRVEVF